MIASVFKLNPLISMDLIRRLIAHAARVFILLRSYIHALDSNKVEWLKEHFGKSTTLYLLSIFQSKNKSRANSHSNLNFFIQVYQY
jgi:hypothetical protein